MKSSLHITVVTNMVDIMLEFSCATTAKLIFIGGTFNRGYDGFIGSQTIDHLANYRFDIAFMGGVGVDVLKNEVSAYMVEDGLTKKAVMDNSRRIYMMLETKKFQADGTYKFAKLDDFTGAVMEAAPPEDVKKKIEEYNIEWI